MPEIFKTLNFDALRGWALVSAVTLILLIYTNLGAESIFTVAIYALLMICAQLFLCALAVDFLTTRIKKLYDKIHDSIWDYVHIDDFKHRLDRLYRLEEKENIPESDIRQVLEKRIKKELDEITKSKDETLIAISQGICSSLAIVDLVSVAACQKPLLLKLFLALS